MKIIEHVYINIYTDYYIIDSEAGMFGASFIAKVLKLHVLHAAHLPVLTGYQIMTNSVYCLYIGNVTLTLNLL